MSQKTIRLAIAGASGRMGRQLISAALTTPAVSLSAALVRPASSLAGSDAGMLAGAGNTGVILHSDIQAVIDQFDVLIDFTQPQNTLALLDACCQRHKGMVIGTTGFDQAGKAAIQQASKQIPLVLSANFSIGVNLVHSLLEKAAKTLGQYSDIEIIEAHHKHKTDAPSGTALAMGETIANALGTPLTQCAVFDRHSSAGARLPGSIGFASIRAGDIVGEHTVIFASEGERVEISHKASNRMIFAHGAIRAAAWLAEQPNGLYDMQQVLNLS